jgi:hypothetical protein
MMRKLASPNGAVTDFESDSKRPKH